MRSFTIESIKKLNGSRVNYTGGRFESETPVASARKAFTKAYHHLKAKGALSLKITIRETTQNSKKKEYSYKITRVSQHTEVERGDQLVVYHFTTKSKSL